MEFKKYDWGQELKHDWVHVEIVSPNMAAAYPCNLCSATTGCVLIQDVAICSACLKEILSRLEGTLQG